MMCIISYQTFLSGSIVIILHIYQFQLDTLNMNYGNLWSTS